MTQEAVPLAIPLRELLSTQLQMDSRVSTVDEGPAAVQPPAVTVICMIEFAAYNPAFWNTNPALRPSNNCYNYASNKRTDMFAQPGRGCGRMYTAITSTEVTRGALCDGLHHRYNCFPDSEKPRYFVALAIAPRCPDFHWYCRNKEGFWGHKPGGTTARNVDNSWPSHHRPTDLRSRAVHTILRVVLHVQKPAHSLTIGGGPPRWR